MCNIGVGKYLNAGPEKTYDDGGYSQGYGEIKCCFRQLTHVNILNLYKTRHEFIPDNGCNK